jgi:hypothetical protein
VIVPLLAADSTTWLFVKINPSLSKKNPEPVPEPADPFTEIETTAGITRAANAAIESGARSTVFDVCTKFAPIFVALPRPIAAPNPPAIKAITTATTKKLELLLLEIIRTCLGSALACHHGISDGCFI